MKKFSKEEAAAFTVKYEEVKKLEKIDRTVGFIFYTVVTYLGRRSILE